MPAKPLRLDRLDLDLENPRIKQAADQREAMELIVKEQKTKLVNLAESIAQRGFSPIDRCLVMPSPDCKGHYTVLEGNRRVLAAKLLKSPALVADLDMPEAQKRRLLKAGQKFDPKTVEPVDCFVIKNRPEGVEWIRQRHSGEDSGRGIVGWNAIAVARFKGRDAALQAIDFVGAHGDLTEQQADLLAGKFPITTLDRLLSTPDVRRAIGFEIVNRKLQTELPPEEALKPLQRMIIDLAEKKVTVTDLKSKEQQLEYIRNFKDADKPDLAKRNGVLKAVEGFKGTDFKAKPARQSGRTRGSRTASRASVIPKACKLNITVIKIEKIYGELKILLLSKHVHAISVLLRVFLEMSVDDYLVTKAKSKLTISRNGHTADKKLAAKVQEVIDHLADNGADRKDFKGVLAALSEEHNAFSIDTLHAYIHNRFFTPTERSLTTGWDNAQRFFEMIWP